MNLHHDVRGQGPALVLLHGWAMHSGLFAPLVAALEPAFELHLVDLPGHGRSRDAGVPLTTTRVGAMFGLFFTDQQVDTYAQAVACDTAAFNRFFHAMLDRGVYLAPSAFEAGFMSSAHDDAAIAATIDAARAAFKAL